MSVDFHEAIANGSTILLLLAELTNESALRLLKIWSFQFGLVVLRICTCVYWQLSTKSTGDVQYTSTNWRPLVLSIIVYVRQSLTLNCILYVTGTEASAALMLSFCTFYECYTLLQSIVISAALQQPSSVTVFTLYHTS